MLARGVNITGWFRFPVSVAPERITAYLSDAAIADLRAAGFSFARLSVQPEFLAPHGKADAGRIALLVRAVARLRAAGLGVVVVLTQGQRPLDGTALRELWQALASVLRPLGAAGVFPELLNEPEFATDRTGWAALQRATLAVLRTAWPDATVILTGAQWGGVDGLLALEPVDDPNVVYSIHFYEPEVLTSLAAFAPGLDRAALATLPFPVTTPCAETATDARTGAVARFYCAQNWNEAAIARRFRMVQDWARRHDAAIVLGEFGAAQPLNAPARLAWIGATRKAAEAAGFGWALWGFDDVMGFNLPRPVPLRPVLDPAILRALGLPR